MKLPQVAIIYSILLIILGMGGYIVTDMVSKTALIPAFFGIPVLILAILAHKEIARKHLMHVISVLALLGFLGTLRAVGPAITILGGGEVERAGAVISQILMLVLSLAMFILCLKSFIDARRARTSEQ